MWLNHKAFLFEILLYLWIFNERNCSEDLDTCTFYLWKVDWSAAVKTCESSNKLLLCYKTKKEIDDITDAFRMSGETKLEIWMSSRNCSTQREECLSFHIQKKPMFHYFQTQCNKTLPFVCCLKKGEVIWTTSTKMTHSTLPTQCKGFKRRGLIWPDTPFGNIAVLNCPGNSVGKATWACSKHGDWNWDKRGPDLRSCRSRDILDLKEKLNTSSAMETIFQIGTAFDDEEKEVFGSDLVDVISILKHLPDRLSLELENETHAKRWTLVKDFAETCASVVDRIIELPDMWKDIGQERRPAVGSNLLSSVESFGALLADSMSGDIREAKIIRRNMGLFNN